MISRRTFLAAAAAGCAGAVGTPRIPVGLQLFSVREQCEHDLEGTLDRVKEIGFEGVEFAGYHGRAAADWKEMLARRSLAICGAHVPLTLLTGQAEATIAFHRQLGNTVLVVPSLPDRYTGSAAGWREAARVMGGLAVQLERAGMSLGYHNHSDEFQKVEGQRGFDVFFRNAQLGVFCELDLGGAGFGGVDPNSVLREYRERVRRVHVKDYAAGKPDLIVGAGAVNWGEFVRLTAESKTEWLVIEHDSDGSRDLADIADSFRGLQVALRT